VDAFEVEAGDVRAADDTDEFFGVVDDGEGVEVVFDEDFDGFVEAMVGAERNDAGAHEVSSKKDRLEIGGLGSEVNVIQGDDAEEMAFRIGDGKGLVGAGGELCDDFEEGVVGTQREGLFVGVDELFDE